MCFLEASLLAYSSRIEDLVVTDTETGYHFLILTSTREDALKFPELAQSSAIYASSSPRRLWVPQLY